MGYLLNHRKVGIGSDEDFTDVAPQNFATDLLETYESPALGQLRYVHHKTS
jgi:hypothetical protein